MCRISCHSSNQRAAYLATSLNSKLNRNLSGYGVVGALARIGIVLAVFVAGAYAQTYNAAENFSSTVNTPSSRWSYRFNTTGTRDGDYMLMTYTAPPIPGWTDGSGAVPETYWFATSSNEFCPCLGANQLTVPLTTNYCCGPVVLPVGSIFVHPSTLGDLGDTVLSFLAPITGTVTVTYSFTDIDPYGGNGIDWYVDLNSGLSGDLFAGTVDSTPGHISTTGLQKFQLAVNKGDRINFIIDARGDASYDSTAIRASVAY
ncbi:MAG: hypothetical protein WAL56_20960 [Candidatus Sulfotelmatobacter sp.]